MNQNYVEYGPITNLLMGGFNMGWGQKRPLIQLNVVLWSKSHISVRPSESFRFEINER